MRIIPFLFIFLTALPCTTACYGSLEQCIDATCRISNGSGRGTGCVFARSDGQVYILTNAHVVEEAKTVQCEFWRSGQNFAPVTGNVLWADKNVDAAMVSVPEQAFGSMPPPTIPFANNNQILQPGQTITSVGCANGSWPTAWRGHVTNADHGNIRFRPPPAGGRSGSAIFNADGTRIVGLLFARDDMSHEGLATAIQSVNHAFFVHRTQCQGGTCFLPSLRNSQQQQQQLTPAPMVPYQSSSDLATTNAKLDRIADLLIRMAEDKSTTQPSAEIAMEAESTSRLASIREALSDRLPDGNVGLTMGKIVGGALGLSGPLAIAVAAAGWFISQRIHKKIENDDPLLVQKLYGRLSERIESLRDRVENRVENRNT